MEIEMEHNEEGWTTLEQRHYQAGLVALSDRVGRKLKKEIEPIYEWLDPEREIDRSHLRIYSDGSLLWQDNACTELWSSAHDWADYWANHRIYPQCWRELPDGLGEYFQDIADMEVNTDEKERDFVQHIGE